jgi:predicted DNA-binding protein (MmcQ/YjbR family)
MNIEAFRDYCLSLPGTTESFPFGDDTLVFKVVNKMYCLAGVEPFERFNVKCDPEHAIALREQYPAVQPGYHMNKQHWNSVYVDGSISDDQLKAWVKDSYDLILNSVSKARRESAGL